MPTHGPSVCGQPESHAEQRLQGATLTKRHCLTCGHYQASGSDGMGWCNNPRRKIASDIRLYVRGAQLSCRDSWDHDLWEDKETFAAPSDVVVNNGHGPVAPASLDDIAFVTSSQRPSGETESPESGSAVDRVISEGLSGGTEITPRGTIRGSVRRAHQMMQADRRVERFADGAPSFDGGFSLPPAPSKEMPSKILTDRPVYTENRPAASLTPSRPAFNAVPPIQPDEMDRTSAPKIAIYPSDEDRFSSVPRPVDGIALPKVERRERRHVIQSTTVVDDAAIAADRPAPARMAMPSMPLPAPGGRPVEPLSTAAEAIDGLDDDDEIFDRVPELAETPPAREKPRSGGHFWKRRPAPERAAAEPFDDGYVDADEALPAIPEIERRPATIERRDEPMAVEADWRVASVDDAPSALVARQTALWAEVPRMCRTCRDFRPAESGDRGWCNNKWAFNHRRMVDADERPCDSSVGCWWLPHDDVWLASSDISAHGQPTPLLDLWLGQRRGRDADADSGSIQRRKRG